MRAQPEASHWIGGMPVEDAAGVPLPVVYPATGEPIAALHEATEAVVEVMSVQPTSEKCTALQESGSAANAGAAERAAASAAAVSRRDIQTSRVA
jgi:hypothetical protein